MNAKIERAKRFARKHSHTLAYAAGVGMGGWFMYSTMQSTHMPRHITLHLTATPDRLKRAIDECNGLPLRITDRAANVAVDIVTATS